jgi:hypothetical protein
VEVAPTTATWCGPSAGPADRERRPVTKGVDGRLPKTGDGHSADG